MIGTQVFVFAVGLYAALAAATDLRMRRIPNYLTVPAALGGLVYHCLAPTGWGAWASLGGFGLGFALLLLPWLAGGGGMGDVKLLAGLGAWLGPGCLLAAFGVGAVVAGVFALNATLFQPKKSGAAAGAGPQLPIPRRSPRSRRQRPTRAVPFAVPMAVGTYTVLTWLVVRGGL